MTALQRAMFLVVVTSGACAQGVMPYAGDDEPGGANESDAGDDTGGRDGGLDANTVPDDENPPPPDGPVTNPPSSAKLVLTEVVLAPSAGEFIEIANPTDNAVDLGAYYVSDSGTYFRTPAGPTVDGSDFIAKFPAGTTIPAHGVITVALDTAANFTATYGSAPTIALAQMTMVASSGTPSLTNAGEIVVLFRWDGATDLVNDVDMILVGAPSAANGLVDKSGVAIDGPDANQTPSTYKTDVKTLPVQPSAPGQNKSTKRVAPEASFQMALGTGNGMMGDDETSEDTASTWDTTAFTAPTPGTVPASLM